MKTSVSSRQFRERHPTRPLLVTLTGTDIFGDATAQATTQEILSLADRVIVLQHAMGDSVDVAIRPNLRVILQSATVPKHLATLRRDHFDVCVLGHLRQVKDPFLTALAVRDLPRDSRLHVWHVGGELEPGYADQAKQEMQRNSRYVWLGERPRSQAVRILANSRLLVMTSLAEGGPSAISESLVCKVPILSTRTAGAVGILGTDYLGLFECGDVQTLRDLLQRAEHESAFLNRLRSDCLRIRPSVLPAAERRAWQSLFKELHLA